MSNRVELAGDGWELAVTFDGPAALHEALMGLAQFVPGQSRRKVSYRQERVTHRTDEDVLALVARAKQIGVKAAAREAGVGPTWLSRVINGHIWKHLNIALPSDLRPANGVTA